MKPIIHTANLWRQILLIETLTSGILQSALNDLKVKSTNVTSKVPCIYTLQHPESQIVVRYALRLAILEIVHIL